MSIAEQMDALLGQAGGTAGREMSRSGLTLAKVTNIQDDKKFNRVKCLPIGSADAEETDWCYVMTPMGGKGCGMFFFPQVNDLVVLAYLDDDPHRPVVLGSIWNTEAAPPFTIQDGKVEDYAVRTPRGIDWTLHDEDQKQSVTLTMPSGAVLRLDDGAKTATLQDKDGGNALELNWDSGEAKLCCAKKLTLSAGDTTVTLESGGALTVKCSGKLSAQAGSAEVKATGQLALQGSSTAVKGDSTLELSSSGMATLKGGMVKIN